MSKKPKKPNGVIDILKDWDDKEILLTESVFKYHIASAAHDEAYLYYETLKANIAIPESVKMSKACKDTKIANIRLNDRKHNYLRVVIRYATVFNKILGTRNQIVTFYGADSPIEGEDICFKKR